MFETDAFLISNFFTILHQTGFETLSHHEREAYVLVVKGKKIIITDSRYAGGEHNEQSELYILQPKELVKDVVYRIYKDNNCKTLGCEAEDIKWEEAHMLQEMGIKLMFLSGVFSSLRSIKTTEEIFAIKQACHVGDLVLKDITPYIHPGQTEKEIAWYIEKSIREGYNCEVAFDPIVAVDAHGAIPHYNTKKGQGVVHEGSLLLIDFGVRAHNYCSDITRMVGIGNISDEIKQAYESLLSVQKKTISHISTCATLKDVDVYCRNELQKKSLPNFGHSTGHGVGLEVHELPRVSTLSNDTPKQGQVFTIEPGVYYPGKWGMRLEDTVTISDQGAVEELTRFPKALILV